MNARVKELARASGVSAEELMAALVDFAPQTGRFPRFVIMETTTDGEREAEQWIAFDGKWDEAVRLGIERLRNVAGGNPIVSEYDTSRKQLIRLGAVKYAHAGRFSLWAFAI